MKALKTGKGKTGDMCCRKVRRSMALLLLFLTISACGNRENREEGDLLGGDMAETEVSEGQVDSFKEEDSQVQNTDSQDTNAVTATAEFHYLPLPFLEKDFAGKRPYAIDNQWMYYTREVDGTGEDWDSRYLHIDRSRISDGYREEDYYVNPEKTAEVELHVLLPDGEGNCYAFWGPGYYPQKEEIKYFLEKYGGRGEVLWHREYSPEDLLEKGDFLKQGTVTADGRVFLYAGGRDGKVFVFGKEGELETVHSPNLEYLEGVAGGKDNKVYGYCLSGVSPVFAELGDSKEKYVCPIRPLKVYNGNGSEICLQDGEGVWSYDPETGETEQLWNWKDEYIQIDGDDVGRVFRDGGKFTVMCFEQITNDRDVKPIQTFAFVSLEEGREHPSREVITLSTVLDSRIWKNHHLDYLVKWYNRQSESYRVEIVGEKDQNSLEMKFVKGECSDLIDLTYFYTGNLAAAGAFEDLTAYYEASGRVRQEDILDSVREACVLSGKNVLVMPGFCIDTLRNIGDAQVEKWDIWEFLELGQSGRMFREQSPSDALMYCMGIRRGKDFVDYEKKKSYFDTPEFCRILESCSQWQTYGEGGRVDPGHSGSIEDGKIVVEDDDLPEGGEARDSLFDTMSISNPWWAVSDTDEKYSARLVGYPGREGAEYKLNPSSIFAMNSTSRNKEGAWDFLEYLLSPEVQERMHWAFPSRKDSFDKCLTDIYVTPARTRTLHALDEAGNPVENGNLKELTPEDTAVVRRMVDNGVYDSWGGSNSPLWDIVADEAGMYFAGDAGLEETVEKIQNRVQLYLDEQ